MRRVRLILCALLVALASLPASPPAGLAAEHRIASLPPDDYPPLFGTREIYSRDLSAFYKWTGMLARFRAERLRAAEECAPRTPDACMPAAWRRLVHELRRLPLRARIERVNTVINRYPYVPSMRNWGEANHWETPFEFFRRSGQCQDYAITKYLLLRAAGVPADRLRVVVVHDARIDLDHAVTVAYVGGEALMLDNQLRDVVPVESIGYYQPYYSINEQGWWLHRGLKARYAQVPPRAAVN